MSKVYLATSWSNEHYTRILQLLRDAGHSVYDYREKGFLFSNLVDAGVKVEGLSYKEQYQLLQHPASIDAYGKDYEALRQADVLIMLYPCGNDAHVELGWCAGAGKYTIVHVLPGYKVGLMDLVASAFTFDDRELLAMVR